VTEPDNGTIKFTVKELLGKMDVKLDTALSKLDGKADGRDLVALELRFNELKTQVDLQNKVNEAIRVKAEETAKTSASNFTRREKLLLGAITVAAFFVKLYVVFGA
jgi:hypothetical protein